MRVGRLLTTQLLKSIYRMLLALLIRYRISHYVTLVKKYEIQNIR